MSEQINVLIPRQSRKLHFLPSSCRIVVALDRLQTAVPQMKFLQQRDPGWFFALKSWAPVGRRIGLNMWVGTN